LRAAQLVGITKPACALLALRCPYSGTAAGVPMMPNAGRLVCESVSGCGRHRNYWTDLQQFQQSHTTFGIHIENAVTFGMCIAVIAGVAQRQWSGSIEETAAR
jgi:hypothetical protein